MMYRSEILDSETKGHNTVWYKVVCQINMLDEKFSTLKMETACSSKIQVTTHKTTQRYISEDHDLNAWVGRYKKIKKISAKVL